MEKLLYELWMSDTYSERMICYQKLENIGIDKNTADTIAKELFGSGEAET